MAQVSTQQAQSHDIRLMSGRRRRLTGLSTNGGGGSAGVSPWTLLWLHVLFHRREELIQIQRLPELHVRIGKLARG